MHNQYIYIRFLSIEIVLKIVNESVVGVMLQNINNTAQFLMIVLTHLKLEQLNIDLPEKMGLSLLLRGCKFYGCFKKSSTQFENK